MAFEISNYYKSKRSNNVLGNVAMPSIPTLRLKLFSNIVDLDGTGTELSGGGYAALDIANNTTNFPPTATGTTTNAVAFTMTTLTADSLEVVSAGIFDTAGNLLIRKVFATPFIIPSGQAYLLGIGDFSLTDS